MYHFWEDCLTSPTVQPPSKIIFLKIYRKSIDPGSPPKFIPNLLKIYFTYPEIHLFLLPPLPCEAPKYYASTCLGGNREAKSIYEIQ